MDTSAQVDGYLCNIKNIHGQLLSIGTVKDKVFKYFPLDLFRIIATNQEKSKVIVHAIISRKSKEGGKLKSIEFIFATEAIATAWSNTIMQAATKSKAQRRI